MIKTQSDDQQATPKSINVQSDFDGDSDDLESYDSNPALFSDDEEEAKRNPLSAVQAILNQTKQQQTT